MVFLKKFKKKNARARALCQHARSHSSSVRQFSGR